MSPERSDPLFPGEDFGHDRLRRLRKARRIGSHLAREARLIRRPADAKRLSGWFLSWASKAIDWRARRVLRKARRVLRRSYWKARRVKSRGFRVLRRSYRQAPRTLHRLVQSEVDIQSATYRLGPEIAVCGPKAAAVFAASSRVIAQVDPTVEVILADEPALAPDRESPGSARVLFLADMDPSAQTPAFDAEQANPRNWPRRHSRHAAALGSRTLLPEPDRVRWVIDSNEPAAGRRFHHIEDIAAYHGSAAARAGTLATFAAFGALVHVADEDPRLRRHLGSNLYSLMTDPRIVVADQRTREALSIGLRREALRSHSLRARARQVLDRTDLGGPPLPVVSVLLATRRPERLRIAVEAVARQSYPRIELVLAMHGPGFDHAEADRVIAGLAHPARLVQAPSSAPLGEVLDTAVRASTGTLLTKFDDDDLYGPEHIWDLVLAVEYSKADLVGKAAEYVYLSGSDRTLHRFGGEAERGSSQLSLAGGAMMISRHDLDAVLGWRRIPAGVDRALMQDVVASGRRMYRTHGMGYMLVRHGEGHAWQADDDYFLKQADEVRDGCDLDFAGIT